MTRRVRRSLTALPLALAVMSTLAQAQVNPQEMRRFRVLVPDFFAAEGADRDFGEDVAKELRELMASLVTHQAMDKDAVEDALDAFDLDMDELDCLSTRQLASRMTAEVALCASYTEAADGTFQVEAVFWDVRSAESFEVSSTSGREGAEEEVARHIFQEFDTYTTHVRAAGNCEDFARSSAWSRALENCDEALRLNPRATGTRYRRARILYETGDLEEAILELERVLEDDPVHEAALQLAGYISASRGRSADAHDYYSRYLELSPESAGVRMRVAYEVAQAGDLASALLLIQEGLDIDPGNLDLWEQAGGYAFSLGEELYRATDREDGNSLSPDIAGYFREATEAFERVAEARGAETAAALFRRLSLAHFRLGHFGDAAAWARQGLEHHGDQANLWAALAQALRGMDRLEEGVAALERVLEIDPHFPGVALRRVNWLLELDRIDEAAASARALAEEDPEKADPAARSFLARGHGQGVQRDRFDYAVTVISEAVTFPGLTETARHELNFWLGYSLVRDAAVEQEPRTVETARATLPRFQRALEVLQDVGEYPASVGVDIGELRGSVETYIEIQDAIIRRGR